MPKIDYEKLEKELFFEKKNSWEVWDEKQTKEALAFSEGYKHFLDEAKTVRESVKTGIRMAEKAGFKPLEKTGKLKTGDKVYAVNKNKTLALVIIGKNIVDDGFGLVMSHIDSPHLDLKVNPLYEDEAMAFFKTHYYGGIRKYQWPTIPLALHGTVALASGKKVEIKIGEKAGDPVFMITDLLPHLGRNQANKTLDSGVPAEDLNILVGSLPVKNDKVKAKIKLAIMEYLNKEYGMVGEDFFSAEIEAVPESKARDLGFDRSFVTGFGQDDRVCAYASIAALLKIKPTKRTQICLWVDREEIGSDGATGAKSIFIESLIADLLEKTGKKGTMREVYQVMERSEALSSDVTAGCDPDYKQLQDPLNVAKMGFGVAIERHTGHGGKYGTTEARAEYVQRLRAIFNKNKVIWQTASLAKVDEGGGGTIAKFLAERNMDVIDIGV
ncbi:aminopeptidase, partial [Candidatus Falkowbacteria bacterium]|nr:aminopeptidase [Candidatus Falkowbacteria bacterium]